MNDTMTMKFPDLHQVYSLLITLGVVPVAMNDHTNNIGARSILKSIPVQCLHYFLLALCFVQQIQAKLQKHWKAWLLHAPALLPCFLPSERLEEAQWQQC
jgi:hypothetical protein